MGTICFETKQPIKPRYNEHKIITKQNNTNKTSGLENYGEAPVCNNSTSGNDNHIIAEIEINKELIGKDIRIINSYESFERSRKKTAFDEKLRNEIEIRKCKIFIEGNLIPFSYIYKFDKEGTFKIKYCFKNNLKSLYGLFCECIYIKTLNFSNFNSNDAISTEYMFYRCYSLNKLNLTNFNTKNVTNMQYMFYYCDSLNELNLTNFNTKNVTDMQYMFYSCSNIKKLNLSSFNTNSVTSMQYMFKYCSSLTDLDLSNFKTQKNTKLEGMFGSYGRLTKSLLICYDEKILGVANNFLKN